MREYHVKALLLLVYGWLSKITCQMAPLPFGFDNFLFGGLGAFPPPQPIGLPPIGPAPIGIENLFGQAQFSPPFGVSPPVGGFSMGPLPFPLFPMPCDVVCDHGGLFFANIAVTNPQQTRPAAVAGIPGAGAIATTMRPATGAAGAAAAGAAGAAARPGAAGAAAGGAAAGATPTRAPTAGAAGIPTTMTTRPPTIPGAGGMAMPQSPNINAQILYFYPNWCTGWCRFFYRPRPMMPPQPPPPPALPLPLPHPACLLFSWLGL